jgi:Gram-negative bacterial TonB protein C-terminal
MKQLFFTLFISPFILNAQDKTVKYYDEDISPASKEKSTYYAEFVKQGDRYNCTIYWTASNALNGKMTCSDTTLSKPIGLVLSYYKNGRTEDSSFYDDDSKVANRYHYYQNRQLELHYYFAVGQTQPVIEAYDETGRKIKNYVYEKEAEFKGGEKAWHAFLLKNLNTELRTQGISDVTVTVKVMFVVNEFGFTAKPKIVESSGVNAVDKDAIRVILASPQWNNAVSLNKPVKVYRIQPITYQLKAKKN